VLSISNFVGCRQYEERELRVQEERAQKRMEFDNQKMRLTNQLEFERSRDTQCELTSSVICSAVVVNQQILILLHF
jgi:hypothetical protein